MYPRKREMDSNWGMHLTHLHKLFLLSVTRVGFQTLKFRKRKEKYFSHTIVCGATRANHFLCNWKHCRSEEGRRALKWEGRGARSGQRNSSGRF